MKSCYGHLRRKPKITYLAIVRNKHKRPQSISEITYDDKLHIEPTNLHEAFMLLVKCTEMLTWLPSQPKIIKNQHYF